MWFLYTQGCFLIPRARYQEGEGRSGKICTFKFGTCIHLYVYESCILTGQSFLSQHSNIGVTSECHLHCFSSFKVQINCVEMQMSPQMSPQMSKFLYFSTESTLLTDKVRFDFKSYLSQILMDLASIWLILKLIETRGAPPGPRLDPTRQFANGAPQEPGPRESLVHILASSASTGCTRCLHCMHWMHAPHPLDACTACIQCMQPIAEKVG